MNADSKPLTSETGRTAIPLVMGILSAAFVALVVYQYRMSASPPVVEPGEKTEAPAEVETSMPNPKATPAKTEAPATASAEVLSRREQIKNELRKLLLGLPVDVEIKDGLQAQKFYQAEEALLDYFESLSEEDALALAELLGEEENFIRRHRLITGLGIIGGDEAAGALGEYYEDALEQSRVRESHRAIEALGRTDSDLSYDLLNGYIDNARREDRYRFITELGNHSRRQEAVPRLTELLETEPGDKTRNRAAQALKKAADPKSAGDIERLLETEKNPYVRQTMIGALGEIGDPRSLPKLEGILKTDDELSTRLSAVNATRRIGTTRARLILQKVATDDKEDRVRRDAARAVQDLEDRGF